MSTVSPTLPRYIRAAAGGLILIVFVALIGAHAGDASAASGNQKYIGGNKVQTGAMPYVAGLRTPGQSRFFCTGTLVDKKWVLTAAHCVDGGKKPSEVHVVLNETDLNTTTDAAELLTVDKIVVHPHWGGDTADENDVAMLRLTNTTNITPVLLGRVGTGKSYFGVGWGRTSNGASTTSSTLQRANATNVSGPSDTFWEAQSGACPGDSGGPLFVKDSAGNQRQIGVASYNKYGWWHGSRCSRRGYDYYSEVSKGHLRYFVDSTITPPQPTGPAPGSCPIGKPCSQPDIPQGGSGPVLANERTAARG